LPWRVRLLAPPAEPAVQAFPATGSPGASLPPSASPLNWSSSFDFSFIAQCDSAGSAYLSTGRTLAPWSPSPGERLSLSQTTMGPPTLTAGLVGLLNFTSCGEPPTFTGSDSARSLRQRFPIQPLPLFAVSRMEASFTQAADFSLWTDIRPSSVSVIIWLREP
jgi:hypothetical protein